MWHGGEVTHFADDASPQHLPVGIVVFGEVDRDGRWTLRRRADEHEERPKAPPCKATRPSHASGLATQPGGSCWMLLRRSWQHVAMENFPSLPQSGRDVVDPWTECARPMR